MLALLLPGNDYEAESKMIQALEQGEEVDHCLGLANTEAEDGYMLTDSLTPRQLSEVMEIDYEICQLLYQAYAADQDEYGRILNGDEMLYFENGAFVWKDAYYLFPIPQTEIEKSIALVQNPGW